MTPFKHTTLTRYPDKIVGVTLLDESPEAVGIYLRCKRRIVASQDGQPTTGRSLRRDLRLLADARSDGDKRPTEAKA